MSPNYVLIEKILERFLSVHMRMIMFIKNVKKTTITTSKEIQILNCYVFAKHTFVHTSNVDSNCH